MCDHKYCVHPMRTLMRLCETADLSSPALQTFYRALSSWLQGGSNRQHIFAVFQDCAEVAAPFRHYDGMLYRAQGVEPWRKERLLRTGTTTLTFGPSYRFSSWTKSPEHLMQFLGMHAQIVSGHDWLYLQIPASSLDVFLDCAQFADRYFAPDSSSYALCHRQAEVIVRSPLHLPITTDNLLDW